MIGLRRKRCKKGGQPACVSLGLNSTGCGNAGRYACNGIKEQEQQNVGMLHRRFYGAGYLFKSVCLYTHGAYIRTEAPGYASGRLAQPANGIFRNVCNKFLVGRAATLGLNGISK